MSLLLNVVCFIGAMLPLPEMQPKISHEASCGCLDMVPTRVEKYNDLLHLWRIHLGLDESLWQSRIHLNKLRLPIRLL